jgi:hypothetical protein
MIAAEGSEQLGSLPRSDRFPVSYSGVLRLGGVTFGELPDLWRDLERNVNSAAATTAASTVPKKPNR